MFKKAFTLLEMLVSVIIMSVIIWMIIPYLIDSIENSFDKMRKWHLLLLSNSLEKYKEKEWILPLPDNYIKIYTSWWVLIWYQWEIWTWLQEKLELITEVYDPQDKTHFTYFVWYNRQKYWLISFFRTKSDVWTWYNLLSLWEWEEVYPFAIWLHWVLITTDWKPVNKVYNNDLILNWNEDYIVVYKSKLYKYKANEIWREEMRVLHNN